MSKLINRLHLYPTRDIAKIEFAKAIDIFKNGKFGPFEI